MTDFEKRMYVLGMVQALPATARDDFVEEVEKVFSGNGPQAYGAVGIFMAVDDVVGTIVTTLEPLGLFDPLPVRPKEAKP